MQSKQQGPSRGSTHLGNLSRQSVDRSKTVLETCESDQHADDVNRDTCSIKRLNNVQRVAILRILVEHEADYAKDCVEHGYFSRQCPCFWRRMAKEVEDQLGWTFTPGLLKRRMTEVLIRMVRNQTGGDPFTSDMRELVTRWEAIMTRHEQRLDYQRPSTKSTSPAGTTPFDAQMWGKSVRNAVDTELATVNDPFLDDDERVRSLLRLVIVQRRECLDAVTQTNAGLKRTILELATALGLRQSALLQSDADQADGMIEHQEEQEHADDQDLQTKAQLDSSTGSSGSLMETNEDPKRTEPDKDDLTDEPKRRKDKKKKGKKGKKSSSTKGKGDDGQDAAPPTPRSEGTAPPERGSEGGDSRALARSAAAAPTSPAGAPHPAPELPKAVPSGPAGGGRSGVTRSTTWSNSPSPHHPRRYHSSRSVDLGHSPGMFVTPTPSYPVGPRSMSQKRYHNGSGHRDRAWKKQRTDDQCVARTPGAESSATSEGWTPRGVGSQGSRAAEAYRSGTAEQWRASRNARPSTWATPPASAASFREDGSRRGWQGHWQGSGQSAGGQRFVRGSTGSMHPSPPPSSSPVGSTRSMTRGSSSLVGGYRSLARPRQTRAHTMVPDNTTLRHHVMELKESNEQTQRVVQQLREILNRSQRSKTPRREDSADSEFPALSRIGVGRSETKGPKARTHLRF